jgi:hypothetical protein
MYLKKILETAFLVKKNSLEKKFLGNNYPWKRHSLEKNSLEIKFLGVRFIEMTFLGKRFPCYVVLPEFKLERKLKVSRITPFV